MTLMNSGLTSRADDELVMARTLSPASFERPASQDRSNAKDYKRAVRHSRKVRVLKIMLPVMAILLVIGFVSFSWYRSVVPEDFVVDKTGIEGGKLVMRNPSMTGQTANGRPYSLTALRAVQDLTTPDIIELEIITADIPVSHDDRAQITAASAHYDKSSEKIVFDSPFNVTTDSGKTASLSNAIVDVANGRFETLDPVSITLPEASIVANTLRMEDSGQTIIFEDMVKVTIDPKSVRRGENG